MDSSNSTWCLIINQLFSLEIRTRSLSDADFYQRRFDRIRDLLKDNHFYVHDPLGETYEYTRTDCDVILQGESHPPLIIVEVIKPIIYLTNDDSRRLLQAGVVIIQGQVL